VIVDNFSGSVYVTEGSTAGVCAEFGLLAVTKQSQLAADDAAGGIKIQDDVDRTVLRIITKPPPHVVLGTLECDVTILVPRGAKVEVNTNLGDVLVGRTYDKWARLVRVPTGLQELKARTSGIVNYIWVELTPDRDVTGGGSSAPRVVDVECQDGWIRIAADDVVVNARAFSLSGGLIRFDGSLAAGNHSFVSTGAIEAFLPSAASYQFDAEAPEGFVVNEFYPEERRRVIRVMRGTIGGNPESRLVLRSSKGSISIGKLDGDLVRNE